MTKLITVVLCLLAFAAFSLTGCSTGTAPNPLENPAVQTAITALEQEAMQLLNDYIHSHFGAVHAAARR
jgi:PBP1b-binding outer membrane lipoprotein LpoB